MGEYRVPWGHRAERKTDGGTLDSTKDREAGCGTLEFSKEVVNPTGWCFTGHRQCYQEGSRPRKYQTLQPQGRMEVLRAPVKEQRLGQVEETARIGTFEIRVNCLRPQQACPLDGITATWDLENFCL